MRRRTSRREFVQVASLAAPGLLAATLPQATAMIKKPLMAVIGGANLPATPAAMKAARIAVGQSASMVNIALGAVDRALVELKTTGRMTAAQKGALSR